MLLEAVADTLLCGDPFLDAAVDAAGFLGGEGLGGEVVNAGGEAVLNEAAESLGHVSIERIRGTKREAYVGELLDLALLHALLQRTLFGLCQPEGLLVMQGRI